MARPELPDQQLRRIREIHEQAVNYESKSTQEALATVLSLAESALDVGLHFDFSSLVASLPNELVMTLNSIRPDFIKPEHRTRPELKESEDRKIVTWFSRETGTPINQIAIYYPSSDRVSFRVDLSYRAPCGEMELVARLRNRDGDYLSVKYRGPDSSELKETTLDPSAAADRIRGPLSKFAEEADERWGRKSNGDGA